MLVTDEQDNKLKAGDEVGSRPLDRLLTRSRTSSGATHSAPSLIAKSTADQMSYASHVSERDGGGPSRSFGPWRAVGLVCVLGLVALNVLHNARSDDARTGSASALHVTPAVDVRALPAAELAARAQVEVVMYSTSWCGYCRAARAWLSGQGITYVDHDVEREPAAHARHVALSPGGGVPVFEVDGTVAHGFDAISLGRLIEQAAAKRAEQATPRSL